MAEFGANYPCFKADEETVGIVLGKLVSANLTVTLASGEIYADDGLAEQLSEFASGKIAMETDDLEDEKAAKLYGCTVNEGEVTYNKDDLAPLGGLGYYKTLMRGGKKFFRGYFYPRVRAALGNDSAKTRGNSITFTPVATELTVFADDSGNWRKVHTFDKVADVRKWIEGLCSITPTPTKATPQPVS